MPTIGDNLKKIRKSKKMTQKELSERSGVSQSGISEIEKFVNHPSTATLILLANGLGCSVADILDGTQKETADDDSDLEEQMIRYFRALPSLQQKKALQKMMNISLGLEDNP